MDAFEATRLEGTEGVARPFWSPDSKYLAFFVGRTQLKKISVLGGPAHVNFGGLAMVRGRLLASSMEGLFERELGPRGVDWQPQLGTLGLDVTGVAPVKGGLWVAGRRGLVLLGAR